MNALETNVDATRRQRQGRAPQLAPVQQGARGFEGDVPHADARGFDAFRPQEQSELGLSSLPLSLGVSLSLSLSLSFFLSAGHRGRTFANLRPLARPPTLCFNEWEALGS